MKFKGNQSKPDGQSWQRKNDAVGRDDAVDGKYKTNAQKQADLRDRVLDDPDISRGVTITSATGHRWQA